MSLKSALIKVVPRPVIEYIKWRPKPITTHLFLNRRRWDENIIYGLYSLICKLNPGFSKHKDKATMKNAKNLREKRYVYLKPTKKRAEVAKKLEKKLDKYLKTKKPGQIMENCLEKFPEIINLIDKELEKTIENFYGSKFKVYYVAPYRAVPFKNPSGSFLWHSDNDPRPVMKIMVYLTKTTKDTGAFRSHALKSSRKIFKEGFFNRDNAEKFSKSLENKKNYEIFEGPPGTAIIFDNNLVHRGFPPKKLHRDVVVFTLLPSIESWRENYKKMGTRLSYDKETRGTVPYMPFFAK